MARVVRQPELALKNDPQLVRLDWLFVIQHVPQRIGRILEMDSERVYVRIGLADVVIFIADVGKIDQRTLQPSQKWSPLPD